MTNSKAGSRSGTAKTAELGSALHGGRGLLEGDSSQSVQVHTEKAKLPLKMKLVQSRSTLWVPPCPQDPSGLSPHKAIQLSGGMASGGLQNCISTMLSTGQACRRQPAGRLASSLCGHTAPRLPAIQSESQQAASLPAIC